MRFLFLFALFALSDSICEFFGFLVFLFSPMFFKVLSAFSDPLCTVGRGMKKREGKKKLW